jgi:hypothetical protein
MTVTLNIKEYLAPPVRVLLVTKESVELIEELSIRVAAVELLAWLYAQ